MLNSRQADQGCITVSLAWKTLSHLFWRTNDLCKLNSRRGNADQEGLPIDAEWLTQGSVLSVSDAGRSFSLRCLVIGGLAFGERGSCRSFTYD